MIQNCVAISVVNDKSNCVLCSLVIFSLLRYYFRGSIARMNSLGNVYVC